MKKNLIITLQLCMCLFFQSLGQDNLAQEVEDLIRAHIIQKDYLLNLNTIIIEQAENFDISQVIQAQKKHSSSFINLIQKGNGNYGLVKQTGSVHTSHLFQSGEKNEANLTSTGNNIHITITQNGEENLINAYIENHNPETRLAELTQEGSFNKINLSLRGDGFTDPALEQRVVINQFGNSHELSVNRDPFSTPLEITQTAGAGGEGMTVEISTSVYSLPVK